MQYNSIREYQGICSSTVGPRMSLGLILLNVKVEDERTTSVWIRGHGNNEGVTL